MTGLAVMLLSQSGCKLDWDKEEPTHKAWHGYCVCGYCNRAQFYNDGTGYKVGHCPAPFDCWEAVRVRSSILGGGEQDHDALYCYIDGGGAIDDAISLDACNESWSTGRVQDCWDTPECVTEDPEACMLAGDITPDCSYGLDRNEYPRETTLIGVEDLPTVEERRVLAAGKLFEKCVMHSHGFPPPDDRGKPDGTVLDTAGLRHCFVPCLWEDQNAEGDPDIDPPSTTARSSIFEIDPASSYAVYVLAGEPEIYAHLNGTFSINFEPKCIVKDTFCPYGHCPCDVAVSSLYVDTRETAHEPWVVTMKGEQRTVLDFTIINKKWIEGTMDSAGEMVFAAPDIGLYATVDMLEEGRIGIDYPEAESRHLKYDHYSRAAWFELEMPPDELGGIMTIRVYGDIIHEPPVAWAGDDISAECWEPTIPLDARWTTDRDDDISNYFWTLVTSSGEWKQYMGKILDVPMEFPVGGSSLVRLDVLDAFGLMDYDFMEVAVGPDDQPPRVEEIVLPASCLWPADHRKVKFKLDRDILCEVYDICSNDPVEVRIVNATSDQPESIWYESVKTQDDVTFSDTAVCMRAERSFVDLEDFTTGRNYTIALEFEDSSGNKTTELVKVRVPFTFSEEDKETCGDLSLLDWVETPEEEQECLGREGQYPPAPPPPGCLSSIAGRGSRHASLPVLALLLGLLAAALWRRLRS